MLVGLCEGRGPLPRLHPQGWGWLRPPRAAFGGGGREQPPHHPLGGPGSSCPQNPPGEGVRAGCTCDTGLGFGPAGPSQGFGGMRGFGVPKTRRWGQRDQTPGRNIPKVPGRCRGTEAGRMRCTNPGPYPVSR